MTVARNPGYVMWNVMFIMALVGFFSFATYVLDPSEVGDRQAVVLTLVLTTVAFKFVTMSMMPPDIPYLTMLDVVIYSCMMLQAFMLLFVCITSTISELELQLFLDKFFLCTLAAAWLSILIWFLVNFLIILIRRQKYLKLCQKIFHEKFDEEVYREQDAEKAGYEDEPLKIFDFSPSSKRGMVKYKCLPKTPTKDGKATNDDSEGQTSEEEDSSTMDDEVKNSFLCGESNFCVRFY